MSFLRHAMTVAWKDLRIELRTREIVYTMVFFAAMVVLIGSFAFFGLAAKSGGPGSGAPINPLTQLENVRSSVDPSAGILWIAVAFSGTLGVGRAFERE